MGQRLKACFYWVPMALLLLSMAACATQRGGDDLKDTEFKVSLSNVLFTKDGGSESLTITGATEWSYLSNVGENGWLVPAKSGETLTLTATTNPTGQERKAEILISSKQGVQKVYVTQSASDLILSFSENKLTFAHKESEKIVQVTTNSDTWSFEPLSAEASSWLTIVGATSGAKSIILKVAENKSYNDRSTTLLATAQNGEKVGLEVTQKGKLKYLLPYEPEGGSHSDIELITFEQQRGSALLIYAAPAWDNINKKEEPGGAIFLTASDYMPQIAYKRDLGELKYTEAQAFLEFSDPVAQQELQEYHAFLLEHGYQKIAEESTDLEWLYVHPQKAMLADVQIKQGFAFIKYLPYYPQTRTYPTFPALPTGREGWLEQLSNPAIKAEAVLKAEVEAGSVSTWVSKDENTGLFKSAGFDCAKSEDQYAPISLTYWFFTAAPKNATDEYIQSVSEQAMYFQNPEWGIRTEGRKMYVTEEFDALAKAAGYKYDGVNKKGDTFYYYKMLSETKVQLLYLGRVHYTDVNEGKPALRVGYYTMFLAPKAEESSQQALKSALRAAEAGDFEALDQFYTSPRIRMHEEAVAKRDVR